MNNKVFIGLGSNMGDKEENCIIAMTRIACHERVSVLSPSSLYCTSPVSEIAQDDFVNSALVVIWHDTPETLLGFLRSIEDNLGRTRRVKWGPRVIDLDILLFENLVMSTPSLTIPHPELHRRKFAIIPCLEIDPEIMHPLFQRPLKEFLPTIGEDQQIFPVRQAKSVMGRLVDSTGPSQGPQIQGQKRETE